MLIFVGSQAWEWGTFIKGTYGAVETKGGKILQFLDTEGDRVAIGDFAIAIPTERVQQKSNNGVWFKSESEITSVSLAEVTAGFLADETLINKNSIFWMKMDTRTSPVPRRVCCKTYQADGRGIVEGANLKTQRIRNTIIRRLLLFHNWISRIPRFFRCDF